MSNPLSTLRAKTLAAAILAGTTAFALVPSANASPGYHKPKSLSVKRTIASGYVGPLQFAVFGSKTYVADSFTASLYKVGKSAPVYHTDLPDAPPVPDGPPSTADVAGVAINPQNGAVVFTENSGDHSVTYLSQLLPGGKKKVLANLAAFEAKYNPDKINRYGTSNPSQCVIDALAGVGAEASYRGEVDSHAYAVAALGNGAYAVADAGGNDILKVDRWGHISVLAVLPPQKLKITQAIADALGLPSCVVGITYGFEPVPTDVEVGPLGSLLVTTLPGGPEGIPALGARGSVYGVGPYGHTWRIATGFDSATNLAVDHSGNIFVASLGDGRLTEISCGRSTVVATVPGLVAVEFANGRLYGSLAPAAAGGDGLGSVVLFG
jgi:hypothetical protein